MQLPSILAAERYQAARPATAPVPDAGEAQVARAIDSFAATLRQGEDAAMAAMTSGADPHALVQALTQTELAVETAVMVRNRVVEAYQELLRMPV
jgi:flagellar hook-basal body complex protein FliE